MAYLFDFDGAGWYAITNQDQRAGFAMRWDASVFRYLWLWQEFANTKGFPWWGRTYTMALEPWTSYPTLGLPEAIQRQSQITLQPGQTLATRLTATAYSDLAHVKGVHDDGTVF